MGGNKKNTRKLKLIDENTTEIRNNMLVLDSSIFGIKRVIEDTKKGIIIAFEVIAQKIEAIKMELKRQDDFVYGILVKEKNWMAKTKNGNLFYNYINKVYNTVLEFVFYLENSRKVFAKNNYTINDSIDILSDYAYDFCVYSINPSFKNLAKRINYKNW